MAKIRSKFGEQQLVMVNYACGLNQSETGKYFEWIIAIIEFGFRRIWRILRISEGVIHRDLQNSSYPTKAKFNNCFIIHSKYSPVLKGVLPFRFCFFCSLKITQPRPQVFSVKGSITCSGLHFWRHFDFIDLTWQSSFQIWSTSTGYGKLSVYF